MYVDHPLIRKEKIEERDYQINIARSCLERSTLIVLPTGMGKTVIAILVIAEVLKRKGGKILFLAPTKPLVEQHASFLRECLVFDGVAIFTGEVPPEVREILWKESQIIASTPQVIENDLVSGRMTLEEVSLIIFDEAHRAVGDYSYVFVASEYKKKGGLVIGMTASPGSEVERILEVCENLGIRGVEIRTEYDPDVVKYLHEIQMDWVRVDVPEEFKKVTNLLKSALDGQITKLRQYGFLRTMKPVSTKDLLLVQGEIQGRLRSGEKNYQLYQAATAQAVAMKINHAVELVETQGLSSLRSYFDRLEEEGRLKGASRASKAVIKMQKVKEAIRLSKQMRVEHPKLKKVIEVVKDQFSQRPNSRVIVFTHYRDTSDIVAQDLERISGLKPIRFVGQASKGEDRGLRQKEQVEIIEKFKEGEYNVLVATSVAEEGLDIPTTDFVVFYEPIPSEIRTIQRRGRTGRRRPGRVAILITRDTRDEAYYWSARKKERRMHEELERLRKELREKIFVGEPAGEVFTRIRLEKDEVEVKETKKKGQTSIFDF